MISLAMLEKLQIEEHIIIAWNCSSNASSSNFSPFPPSQSGQEVHHLPQLHPLLWLLITIQHINSPLGRILGSLVLVSVIVLV